MVAIDRSEKIVTLAKKRAKGRGVFQVADISAPIAFLKDSEFDLVVCPLVLDYIRDWVPVFREFNRVLCKQVYGAAADRDNPSDRSGVLSQTALQTISHVLAGDQARATSKPRHSGAAL